MIAQTDIDFTTQAADVRDMAKETDTDYRNPRSKLYLISNALDIHKLQNNRANRASFVEFVDKGSVSKKSKKAET